MYKRQHLIYLPERPFREEEFLADVKELYDRLGGVVVVASEGLKDESGKPVVPPIFQTGRSVYYGDEMCIRDSIPYHRGKWWNIYSSERRFKQNKGSGK